MAVSKEKALESFDELVAIAVLKREALTFNNPGSENYYPVINDTESLISSIFGREEAEIYRKRLELPITAGSRDPRIQMAETREILDRAITLLNTYRKRAELELPDAPMASKPSTVAILEQLARRLPTVIHELRQRRNDHNV